MMVFPHERQTDFGIATIATSRLEILGDLKSKDDERAGAWGPFSQSVTQSGIWARRLMGNGEEVSEKMKGCFGSPCHASHQLD